MCWLVHDLVCKDNWELLLQRDTRSLVRLPAAAIAAAAFATVSFYLLLCCIFATLCCF
jgi:hypothetical protein